MYKEIGRRLKQARENCGFTQAQVAEWLGIKREQVSYYETGAREIDLATLSKLSDLYGYGLEHFLEESQPVRGEELSLSFRAAGLSAGDLEAVARARRFAANLAWLDRLLEGREGSA